VIARDKATGKIIGQVVGNDDPPVWGEIKILTSSGVISVPVTSVTLEQTN
jgi:hypothetical protein